MQLPPILVKERIGTPFCLGMLHGRSVRSGDMSPNSELQSPNFGPSKAAARHTVEGQNDAPPQTHFRKDAGDYRSLDCNVRVRARSRERWCNHFVLSPNENAQSRIILGDATICLFAVSQAAGWSEAVREGREGKCSPGAGWGETEYELAEALMGERLRYGRGACTRQAFWLLPTAAANPSKYTSAYLRSNSIKCALNVHQKRIKNHGLRFGFDVFDVF